MEEGLDAQGDIGKQLNALIRKWMELQKTKGA